MNFLKFLLYLVMNLSLLTASFLTVILQLLDCLFPARVIYIQIMSGLLFVLRFCRTNISYLCRYDLILPCPVIIVVKFGVTLIFIFNLSTILGKKDFLIAPFVVLSHSLCHLFTL